MLVESVARHLNAMIIDLSVKNVAGKFVEKGGAEKLLRYSFIVAKDPKMQPCVIYIDDVDMMFIKDKKAPKEGPQRFVGKKNVLKHN